MVLSVDLGEEQGVLQAFAEEHKLTYRILLDEGASVTRSYNVRLIPASFFIDREGVICTHHIGPLREPLIAKYLQQLL